MKHTTYKADVIIAGGGIAGIITALELLNESKKVILIDRDKEENFGGLAIWSFGGMFFVNSRIQQRAGIKDSIDLAMSDWFSFAEFGDNDHWPKQWAEQFIHLSRDHGYEWLKNHGISFFPVVHWVERGLFKPGNSVPRFHMVWGTGYALAKTMIAQLLDHPKRKNLQLLFRHRVTGILHSDKGIEGVEGIDELNQSPFRGEADVVVVAAGGINGSIERVKANWFKPWGIPPKKILNGSHEFAVGDLHDATEKINGNVTHLDWQWNYAAGVHHPKPTMKDHGLSLVPCKSAIWVNYQGERFGPMPLMTAYDTRYLVERICQEEKKYSWQILNAKIAYKEFAISGSEHNPAIRDKKLFAFLKNILFGNKKLVHEMLDTCPDFVTANSIEELADKMNALTGNADVDVQRLRQSVLNYDAVIDRGEKLHNDEQLRRLAHVRQYRGDRVRTCKFQKIFDRKALPLIAIREFILSRKTLGGIQTDLESRVLTKPVNGHQEPIEGLYAVGEAAGFGGGGMHGLRALEGTLLSGCVITARVAAASIAGKKLS